VWTGYSATSGMNYAIRRRERRESMQITAWTVGLTCMVVGILAILARFVRGIAREIDGRSD
jgi:hypothetical protein